MTTGGKLAGSIEVLRESNSVEASQNPLLEAAEKEVEDGRLEVLSAVVAEGIVGVVVVSYRIAISSGARFASVEELVVEPASRGKGVGRALLEAVGERCAARRISYVEVQAVDEKARSFYEACGYEVEEGAKVMSRSYAL